MKSTGYPPRRAIIKILQTFILQPLESFLSPLLFLYLSPHLPSQHSLKLETTATLISMKKVSFSL